MQLQFRKLTEKIGSEVIGVNLAEPLRSEDMDKIENEFNHGTAVVFADFPACGDSEVSTCEFG